MHASHLLDVTYLLSTYGYIGIFVIIFIESGVFFFLPGDSLLFAAGLLAALGQLHLVLVLGLALVAAYLGNVVGYYVGFHIERLRRNSFLGKVLKEEYVNEAKAFFDKRGKVALLLARFVPAVRTFTPWAAGVAHMDKKTFNSWSALGALVWVLVMTFAGFLLGTAFPGIEKYLSETMLAIVLISIMPGIIEFSRRRYKRSINKRKQKPGR